MTKKSLPTKYSEDQIFKAKELYMRYTPIKEIELQTQMKQSSINYYVRTGWLDEREERKHAIISSFSDGKKVDMIHIMRDGITALKQATKATLLRASDLSLNEMTALTKILESMDKIARLDSGLATEITEQKQAKDTIEIINPFVKIGEDEPEEVEFEELE